MPENFDPVAAPVNDGRYKVPCPCCGVPAGKLCETLQHIPMQLIHIARGNAYRAQIRRLAQQREAIRRGY